MVFRKQKNKEGKYIDQNGVRFDVLSCERTETREWYDTGAVDAQGEPIWDWRVVINKGWDAFDSLEDATEAYGLTYDPLPPEESTNGRNE